MISHAINGDAQKSNIYYNVGIVPWREFGEGDNRSHSAVLRLACMCFASRNLPAKGLAAAAIGGNGDQGDWMLVAKGIGKPRAFFTSDIRTAGTNVGSHKKPKHFGSGGHLTEGAMLEIFKELATELNLRNLS